jgi:prepilin-type N-terminal cleavage/methylation domain-containing protein
MNGPARRPHVARGFTLIEALITVVIVAVAAGLAADLFRDTRLETLDAAVRIMRADLEYARASALASPSDPIVLRPTSGGTGYWLARASAPTTPITGPNGAIRVTFGEGRAETCPGVRLSLSGGTELRFGPFGGVMDPVPTLAFSLLDGTERATVVPDAFTGDVSVTYQTQ